MGDLRRRNMQGAFCVEACVCDEWILYVAACVRICVRMGVYDVEG